MDNIIRCHINNSELAVPKEKREFLTYPAEGLCPCNLEQLEDGIVLEFSIKGLETSESITAKSRADKLRFLINTSELEKLHTDYVFSLAPDNLMYDINLKPLVLKRDLNFSDTDFLCKYKALIGSILKNKYKYEDFLAGPDLYNKNKLLSKLSKLETVDEVRELLLVEYASELSNISATKRLVSKTGLLLVCITLPVLLVIIAALSYFTIRAYYIDIPYQSRIISAGQEYIAGNYIAAQEALASIAIDDMTYETRHFLSRAYVITEPLTEEQKENVLMGLTRMTDSSIFDYWIYLGRLDFDSALEIAQRYGDTELMLFSYMKQEAYVRADTTIPGDEKITILNHLESQINRLIEERTVDEE